MVCTDKIFTLANMIRNAMQCRCDEVVEMDPLHPQDEICPLHDVKDGFKGSFEGTEDDYCNNCGSEEHSSLDHDYFSGLRNYATGFYESIA